MLAAVLQAASSTGRRCPRRRPASCGACSRAASSAIRRTACATSATRGSRSTRSLSGKETSQDPIAAPARGARATWLVGACALGVGLLLGWLLTRGLASRSGGGGAPLHAEFQIGAPDRTSLMSGMALSPDGEKLAFVARGEDGRTALWIRALATRDAKLLPGTTDARFPFWSPDGRKIAFFSQSRLKVTELFGGQPQVVAETSSTLDTRGGTWGAGDAILFAPSFVGPLLSVPARGGKVEAATRIAGGQRHRHAALPVLPARRQAVPLLRFERHGHRAGNALAGRARIARREAARARRVDGDLGGARLRALRDRRLARGPPLRRSPERARGDPAPLGI